MVDLGRILIKIGIDAKALQKGLIRVTGQLKTFSKDMVAVGTSLTKFVTLPILALGAASLKMAASAQESESFFDVAFDGMADSVRSWSDEVSKSLGVSAFEIRENAATINVMAKSMGLAEDDANDMAKGIAVLAQDLASFRDISPERAFEKLRAGITGEAEPLKQLGVLVDENTVKQAAWANGIAESGKELTQTQKVAARWLVIQDQLSLANGDLIRTSGSLTNQSRRLKAGIGDLAREFGAILIPAATKIVKILNNVITFVRSLNPEVKKQIILWAGIAAAVGPAVIAMGGLAAILPAIVAGLTTIIIPLAIIAAKIILFAAAIVAAIILAKTFADDWTVALDFIKASFLKQFSIITGAIAKFLKVAQAVAGKFNSTVAKRFGEDVKTMEEVSAEFDKKAAANFKSGTDKIKASTLSLVKDLKEKVGPAIADLKAQFAGLGAVGGDGGGGGGLDDINLKAQQLIANLNILRQKNLETVTALSEQWLGFTATFSTGFTAFQEVTKTAFQTLSTGFATAVSDALVFGKNFLEGVKAVAKQVAAAVIQTLVKIGIQRAAQALIAKGVASASALGNIKASAAQAGAAAFAATAGIPIVGPVLAPGVAAAAFAGALSFTAAVPFAKGGIVTSPTNALIGEAGPEAVIPLGSNRASGIVGGREQRIMQFLDGRLLSEVVVMGMPDIVRANAGVRI